MTDKEIIDYANKNYPIGTVYIGLRNSKPYTAEHECRWGRVVGGGERMWVGYDYIYDKKTNTWAKIISSPKSKEIFYEIY